jgi:RimJ/RimL family protein N-acetyltransferase
MKLTTVRLILRPVTVKDAKSIALNANNLEVSKWLLALPYPYTLKDAKWWVHHSTKKWKDKKKEDYAFGIELKSENKIIGGIGVHHVSKDQGTGEVGYWIGTNYHQKGYGTEALKEILNFAFNKLKLRRLEAGVFAGNPSSGKLLEKFGFKNEGMKRKARVSKADGQIKDEIIYSLLKEEYIK